MQHYIISIRCPKGNQKALMNTSESNKINIVIADTQFLVISSLVSLIESEHLYIVNGIAENRLQLHNLLRMCTPDLLITDFHLIDYDGIDELLAILHAHNQLSVLILVNQISSNEIVRLVKSGIKNIALKTDSRDDLIASIEKASRKMKYFTDPILDMILEQEENGNITTGLTQSETEIVRMISDGYTTKEIANKKNISIHTVMTHRKNIFRKLEVNSISELTKFAIRNGLTDIIDYNI